MVLVLEVELVLTSKNSAALMELVEVEVGFGVVEVEVCFVEVEVDEVVLETLSSMRTYFPSLIPCLTSAHGMAEPCNS